MPVKPRLAEVDCRPVRFGLHDRVMVRTLAQLEPEAVRRLRKTVAKWAGVDEDRVLVYWAGAMEVGVERVGPDGTRRLTT